MSQKLFISFNSKDRDKAHWIAWTLQEAGHQVAVHDWEIPAGGNAPLWMSSRLEWADRLIAVISPDYIKARYSAMEWAASLWEDPDGTKGAVVPVVVRPTNRLSALLRGLSRLDLTGCDESEAKQRLLNGIERPAAPKKNPMFEASPGALPGAPDLEQQGPVEKPVFVTERQGLILRPVWIVVILVVLAVVGYFGFAERNCTTFGGGIVVCGNVNNQ